ncbi:MAG: gamma-glutamylcyclotransferase [Candidatus Moduliflexus flocculans]|nr:gamma-glutamylcyclotransferase [Candidatus Moduliflexus flocculans]
MPRGREPLIDRADDVFRLRLEHEPGADEAVVSGEPLFQDRRARGTPLRLRRVLGALGRGRRQHRRVRVGERLGALYEITERDKLTLDAFEGYPRSYERKEVEVRDRDGNLHRAVTYFRTGRPLGKPHPDYEKVVLDGARECGLPEDYIDKALRVVRM